MHSHVKDFILALMNNAEAASAMARAGSDAERIAIILSLARKVDLPLCYEDVESALLVESDCELSDEELDCVAGGGLFDTIFNGYEP